MNIDFEYIKKLSKWGLLEGLKYEEEKVAFSQFLKRSLKGTPEDYVIYICSRLFRSPCFKFGILENVKAQLKLACAEHINFKNVNPSDVPHMNNWDFECDHINQISEKLLKSFDKNKKYELRQLIVGRSKSKLDFHLHCWEIIE